MKPQNALHDPARGSIVSCWRLQYTDEIPIADVTQPLSLCVPSAPPVTDTGSSLFPVVATLIMQLVEDGFMSLSSKPQDFLDFWSTDGRKSRVTLHSLLAFTSGFQGGFSDSPCLMDISASIANCTQQIHDRLDDLSVEPGTTFGYSNENLEIAAAMAEAATGMSWSSLYDRYLRIPLNISSSSVYSGNKGAAGNLRISAADYIKVLSSVMLQGNGTNDMPLSQQSLLEMNTDHTAEPEVQKPITQQGKGGGAGGGRGVLFCIISSSCIVA